MQFLHSRVTPSIETGPGPKTQADQALVGQRARPHRNVDRLSPTTPAHSITSSTDECVMNHSSRAIEIEGVEFLVVELDRVAEAQEEETLRPVNLRPPEFQIGYRETATRLHWRTPHRYGQP